MRSDHTAPTTSPPRPPHGGRLLQAARQYGIAPERWLDLSTGINPRPYPGADIPAECWMRLPEDDDSLEDAAAACYGCERASVLPVAGSQAAIQALPGVLDGTRVSILGPTYAEHAWAWHARAPHQAGCDELEAAAHTSDIVVVVNPDNPSGRLIEPARLRRAQAALAARGGWLLVDEAFMDPTPAASMAACAGQPGLIVLRSLGKFFGLAGARVGFVLAPAPVKHALARLLGPWSIAGPSRLIARAALLDYTWQQQTRTALERDSRRLATLLHAHGFGTASGCALFQQVRIDAAPDRAECLARHGILVRRFDSPPRLRFGLPAHEHEWQRLATVLAACA